MDKLHDWVDGIQFLAQAFVEVCLFLLKARYSLVWLMMVLWVDFSGMDLRVWKGR